jgi:outer membrane lipoprotein-sorting protein
VHSWCGELTLKEILHLADEARGNLEGVKWRVVIDSIENGREQKRTLNVKARGYDFLATLISPPKVKGQKVLMVDHNMWFTKPGLRKPVPISPRQKLVGGASYGDIAATNYADDYEATPLDDIMVNGELCYVFDLKAATKKATYDRIKYWISKERIVGVKAEYFTVSGKMLKSAIFENENQIQLRNKPHPFISKMIITDALVKNNVTTMTFSKHKLVKVPASTFDLNLLVIM